MPKRVFISYKSADPDQELASKIYDALQQQGHTVFMAGRSLEWGKSWPEEVNHALNNCDYFLVLLSENSVTSEMVIEEINTARSLRHQHQKPQILPLRIDLPFGSELVPYDVRSYLNRLQQISYQQSTDFSPVLEKLLQIVDGAVTKSETSQSAIPATQSGQSSAEMLMENQEALPLPLADPNGIIPVNSPFYIERTPDNSSVTVEKLCLTELQQETTLISIRGTRQVGKSSLIARTLYQARQQGYRVVMVSFQEFEQDVLSNLKTLLHSLCFSIEEQLELPSKLANTNWWVESIGIKQNYSRFLEKFLLPELASPVVLAIDELDRIFCDETVAIEFLGLMRTWNEKAKTDKAWQKLKLIFSHSTEYYTVIPPNQSPFNVGQKILLPNFSFDEVKKLARLYQVLRNNVINPDDSEGSLEQLFHLVAGHPYLTRLALHRLHQGLPVKEFFDQAASDAGIYSEHLRRHLWNLKQNNDLCNAFIAVLSSQQPSDSLLNFKLAGIGLVKFLDNDQTGPVAVSLPLYQNYFSTRLGRY